MAFHRIPQRSPRQLAAKQKDDARIADAIRTAKHFTTTILCNSRYMTVQSESLHLARLRRIELERIADNHRRAMVYAVTPDNFSHFIPDHFKI